MGRIIRDATTEQEQAFIEERRKTAFLTASKSPLLWRRTAELHKRAANILYEVAHAANEREMVQMHLETNRISAEMKKQGLSSWSTSKTIEGEELRDSLDFELLSDYFLLAGYALECIFKGCMLVKQPELVEDDKKFREKIITHNLAQLCHDCGIHLTKLERQLVNIIACHVKWRKYPIPIKSKDMPSPVEPNKTPLDIPGSPFTNKKAKTLVDGLYQRGYDLLERW